MIAHGHTEFDRLFDLFTSILDIVIQNARIEGQLDSGIVDIKAKSVEMKDSPKVVFLKKVCFSSSTSSSYNRVLFVQTVHVDTVSGASTVLYTFTVDRGVSWEVSFVLKPLSVFFLRTCVT